MLDCNHLWCSRRYHDDWMIDNGRVDWMVWKDTVDWPIDFIVEALEWEKEKGWLDSEYQHKWTTNDVSSLPGDKATSSSSLV